MHPITLRFSDQRDEDALKATLFRRSYSVSMLMLVLAFLPHPVMVHISDEYVVIAVIYVPLILICMVGLTYLRRRSDESGTHELAGKLWTALLLVGNSCQRLTLFWGRHPRITPVGAALYMGAYTLIILTTFVCYFRRAATPPYPE